MKIAICGSMLASKKIMECADILESSGNEVIYPDGCDTYAKQDFLEKESVAYKVSNDLIKNYFNKIKNSDAILVVNVERDGILDYIGGNSFLEMGFAHVLDKKIFLLNSIPNARYKDEIEAMSPKIINGNLGLIR